MSESTKNSREQVMEKCFFRVAAQDFKKIPTNPIAYWLNSAAINAFSGTPIGDILTFKQGIATSDNERFLRIWHEVSFLKLDLSCSSPSDLKKSTRKWFPYNKGGSFRKWYGNNEIVVNWENDGIEMKDFTSTLPQGTHVRLKSREFYCLPCITYSALSSGDFGCRISDTGFLFDTKGSCIFGSSQDLSIYSGLLNSKPAKIFLDVLCPTLDYSMVGIKQVPVLTGEKFQNISIVNNCATLSRTDWDSYETSWGFTILPLLQADYRQPTLQVSYQQLRAHWREMTLDMQRLEEENNRIFIDAYGLQDELTPDVPQNEITLTCNPHYRYGGDKTEEELETMLLADTMRELVSYAVGCMMGRYSLDEPSLIYAHAGNVGFDATRYQTFPADADGIVPITDDFWFEDDAANRVREFLLAVWGADTLDKNMAWLAESLGAKANETPGETIRRYLSSSFFKDHLQTYKKRPIYWLFSSGKQRAFEALVYLHRYNEGTLARMRAEYVVPLTGKMAERIKLLEDDALKASTPAARKKIDKDIEKLKKKLDELRTYDEKLRHCADMRISLDLDDGVKVNYGKFGDLLAEVKAVTGGKDDE